jgi:hypothetical protein
MHTLTLEKKWTLFVGVFDVILHKYSAGFGGEPTEHLQKKRETIYKIAMHDLQGYCTAAPHYLLSL